eukprot:CFRG7969T1
MNMRCRLLSAVAVFVLYINLVAHVEAGRLEDAKAYLQKRKTERSRRQAYGYEYSTNPFAGTQYGNNENTFNTPSTEYNGQISTNTGYVFNASSNPAIEAIVTYDLAPDMQQARQPDISSMDSNNSHVLGNQKAQVDNSSQTFFGTAASNDQSFAPAVQSVSNDVKEKVINDLVAYVNAYPDAVLAPGNSVSNRLTAPCNATMVVDKDYYIAIGENIVYSLEAGSFCSEKCKLTLTYSGKLVLYATARGRPGREVWSSSKFGEDAYGVLFPDGNFVILSSDNDVMFESSEDPSSTNDECASASNIITSRSLGILA